MAQGTVAVYCREFLTERMTFVYAHVMSLRRSAPIVLTTRRMNADVFPFETVLEAGAATAPERLRDRLSRRLLDRFPVAAESALRSWQRRLGALDPRLIHAHFGPGGLDMVSLAKRLGIPLVVTFHGYDGSQLLRIASYRKALPTLFEAAAAILCVCEPMRARLIESGCPPDRVHVRHLGIDTTRFAAANRPERRAPVTFLQLCGLSPKKGVATTLRAFSRARRELSGCRLVLAGDGPERARILALAEELDLGASFDYRGVVSHAEAAQLMAAADVFVHPSEVAPDGDREGLPTAIMEAMASGLPVLSTRHEGIPELVVEGRTGRLLAESDDEGLARAMCEVARSPDRARRWGIAGAERVREHFDLHRKVAELEDLYDTVVDAT